jgi:hypothetical protein
MASRPARVPDMSFVQDAARSEVQRHPLTENIPLFADDLELVPAEIVTQRSTFQIAILPDEPQAFGSGAIAPSCCMTE